MRFDLRGATGVLTGAGSGIGRATALRLAARGCNLALADRNPASLASAAAEIRAAGAGAGGVRVSEHVLDVADADAVASLPRAVLAEHDRVNLLINNAGVAMMGTFDQMTLEEFEWLLNINFLGTVRMTHAFLPELRRQPQAHVVNLSSVFGLVAPAGQSNYVAAKFAVRGFSEAIRHEWAGTNLSLTVVHPGGIKTAIARDARVAAGVDQALAAPAKQQFGKLLITTADTAAARIVHAIEHRRRRLLIGSDAHALDILQRLLPVSYHSVMNTLMGITTGKEMKRATQMQPLVPGTR